jgi:hypothetical protein
MSASVDTMTDGAGPVLPSRSERAETRGLVDGSEREVLAAGMAVAVRTRFEGSWADGFEIAHRSEEGYWLRRASDGHLLPTPFEFDDLRPRH